MVWRSLPICEVGITARAVLARARAPELRVVLRMFDPDLAARVERTIGIYLSRSVSALAAPAFVAAIFGRRTEAVLPVGTEVLQIVDLTAERKVDVGTLEETCQARVMAVGATPFPVLDLESFPAMRCGWSVPAGAWWNWPTSSHRPP